MNTSVIDVRVINPAERHPLIFKTFDGLKTNEFFELVSDHDPRPLYRQFEAMKTNEFSWDYLEQGPLWRIKIGRVVKPAVRQSDDGCCGMCQG
jgi:uncharacterized protein (DUF2249 family)